MRSATDRRVAVRRLRSRLISLPPRRMRGVGKGCLDMAPFDGGFHAVNVATLDGLDDAQLAAIPVQYENGRHDDWDHSPVNPGYL